MRGGRTAAVPRRRRRTARRRPVRCRPRVRLPLPRDPGRDHPCDLPGLPGAFAGIAIDRYGNFSLPLNLSGPGAAPDSVVVRGSGDGLDGYRYVAGTDVPRGVQTDGPEPRTVTGDAAAAGRRRPRAHGPARDRGRCAPDRPRPGAAPRRRPGAAATDAAARVRGVDRQLRRRARDRRAPGAGAGRPRRRPGPGTGGHRGRAGPLGRRRARCRAECIGPEPPDGRRAGRAAGRLLDVSWGRRRHVRRRQRDGCGVHRLGSHGVPVRWSP